MSVFTSAGKLGNLLLGIDTSGVAQGRANLNDYARSGAIDKAAQPLATPEGQALMRALSAPRPLTYRDSSAPQDDAALAAAKAHYENEFRNGGLRSQAAVQEAQLAGDLTSQGGPGGIRQGIADSVGRQQQVANAALQEQGQAGNAANALAQSDAAVALQRAVLAAQVSHGNVVNSLNADQAMFGLRNTQADLNNQTQSAQLGIGNEAANVDIDYEKKQAEIGKAIIQALVGAVSGGGSAIVSQMGADKKPFVAPQMPTSYGTQADPGAGYKLPETRVGGSASLFNTAPAVPVDASYWEN